MKARGQCTVRIGICVLFAVPFYSLGTAGLFGPAIRGYVHAVGLYWFIQVLTQFRHPLNGVLIVALLSVLDAFLLPALAKAH